MAVSVWPEAAWAGHTEADKVAALPKDKLVTAGFSGWVASRAPQAPCRWSWVFLSAKKKNLFSSRTIVAK